MQDEFFSSKNQKLIIATITKVKPGYNGLYTKIPELMQNAFFNTDIIFNKVWTYQEKIIKLNDYVLKELLEIIKKYEAQQTRVNNCLHTKKIIKDIFNNSLNKEHFFKSIIEQFSFEELKFFTLEVEDGIIPKDDIYITIKDYTTSLEPKKNELSRFDNKPFIIFINIDSKFRDISLWQSSGYFRFNIGLHTQKSQIAGLSQLRFITSIKLQAVSFNNTWTERYYNISINEFTGNNFQSDPNIGPVFGTIIRKYSDQNFYDLESCFRDFDCPIDLSTFTIKLQNYNFQDVIRIIDISADIIELACETSDINVGDSIYIVNKNNTCLGGQYTVIEIIDEKHIRINEEVIFELDTFVMIDKFQWNSLWRFVHFQ